MKMYCCSWHNKKAGWPIARQEVSTGFPDREKTLGRRKAESPVRQGEERKGAR